MTLGSTHKSVVSGGKRGKRRGSERIAQQVAFKLSQNTTCGECGAPDKPVVITAKFFTTPYAPY